MSKKTGFEFSDAGLPESKKPNVGKLTDQELDKVAAGKGGILCPQCGSDELLLHPAHGFFICKKCINVF